MLGKLSAYLKVAPAGRANDGAVVFVLVLELNQIGDIATGLAWVGFGVEVVLVGRAESEVTLEVVLGVPAGSD